MTKVKTLMIDTVAMENIHRDRNPRSTPQMAWTEFRYALSQFVWQLSVGDRRPSKDNTYEFGAGSTCFARFEITP